MLVLLTGWILAAGAGATFSAAEPPWQDPQPLVNPRSDVLEMASVAAKVSGSRKRTVAALLRARGARARAHALEMYTEQLKLGSESKTAILKDMSAQATSQSDKAEAASQAAVKAYKEMKDKAKTMDSEAEGLARAEVQKLMSDQFQSLNDWRQKTLQDPHTQAQQAGARAEEPYVRMWNVFTKRVQAYASQAKSLAVQANEVHAESNTISDGAQRKLESGDAVGANQDLELARAMQTHSMELVDSAQALQASANDMNKQTSLYLTAAQAARARAEYDLDPNSMPLLAVDPQTVYTPPPPL